MVDHERSLTQQQKGTHIDSSSGQSRNPERSEDRQNDSHHVENRSDREYDLYDSYRSFHTYREERAPHHGHPRGRRSRSYHRSDKSEDRYSGLIMKHGWSPHDRPKTINSHSHERFDDVDDAFDRRGTSNGYRMTNPNGASERRRPHPPIRGQKSTTERPHERYDRKDEADLSKLVNQKQHHRDNEQLHYNHNYKKEEQEYQESRSPAYAPSYSSSDVTSLRAGHKLDRGDTNDLAEQMEHQPSTSDRRSAHRHRDRHHHHHHNSSRGRPSSRRSCSHSLSSSSDDNDDSWGTHTPKEGPSRRSLSFSGSRTRSESHHRRLRSRSPSKNHSSVKKYSGSSHGHNHSGKRKHKDRSGSHDDRKRRKHKERERERDRDKEKTKKEDEERRSVLTGKKIKLKVRKDKGDHERDANRQDLLQFLNSAFE